MPLRKSLNMNRMATTAIARIPNARNGRLRRRPADRTLHRMTPADSTQAPARTASWRPSASTSEAPSRRWVVTTPAMATPRTPRTNQVERRRAAWVDIIGLTMLPRRKARLHHMHGESPGDYGLGRLEDDECCPPAELLDETPAERLGNRRRAVGRPELLEDVLEVGLHGVGRDVQALGDVPVGVSECEQLEDLDLPRRERLRLAV